MHLLCIKISIRIIAHLLKKAEDQVIVSLNVKLFLFLKNKEEKLTLVYCYFFMGKIADKYDNNRKNRNRIKKFKFLKERLLTKFIHSKDFAKERLIRLYSK